MPVFDQRNQCEMNLVVVLKIVELAETSCGEPIRGIPAVELVVDFFDVFGVAF